MKIDILQEDIDNGSKRVSFDCMVARALIRNLHLDIDRDYVAVGYTDAFIGNKRYTISSSVSKKIRDWDENKKVKPFSVNLNEEKKKLVLVK